MNINRYQTGGQNPAEFVVSVKSNPHQDSNGNDREPNALMASFATADLGNAEDPISGISYLAGTHPTMTVEVKTNQIVNGNPYFARLRQALVTRLHA